MPIATPKPRHVLVASISACLPLLFFCGCESTGDKVYLGVDKAGEDIDKAVNKNLPGLGPNPSTVDDPFVKP